MNTEGKGTSRTAGWIYVAVVLVGVVCGLLLKDAIVRGAAALIPDRNAGRKVLYWASPHDPSFRRDQPGKDSMGMQLVPVYADQEVAQGPVTINPRLTEQEYSSAVVEKGPLIRTIHTVSTIDYAEPRIGDVTLKIDAWLEKLYVDYEGQPVRRGDPLLEFYSPQLVGTQEEFLISLRAWERAKTQNNRLIMETTESNVNAVRQRLRYWDVTDQQIDQLAKAGKVRKTLTFFSSLDGIVIEKHAFDGKFMQAGQLLYRVADLSKVWVHVFVYQNQLHCVYEGQGATLRLSNLPDRDFQGKVIYVYPYLEPKIRAVKVRLEFDNPDLLLKPGMYGDVRLEPHTMGVGLKVPEMAVLRTGERDLVYVVMPGGKFAAREVTTGMQLDHQMVEVLSGLKEGEQVVTGPDFLMDSESRLRSVNRKFEPVPDWTRQVTPKGHGKMEGKMPGMENNGKMPAEPSGPQRPLPSPETKPLGRKKNM